MAEGAVVSLLSSLESQLGLQKSNQYPPVSDWNPPLSGVMDMRIDSEGRWWHEGDQIKRESLVRLFSSILKCEMGQYFLVTPVEKWQIRVDDRPLLIVLVNKNEAGDIEMITQVGDRLLLGIKHPLQMSDLNGVSVPEVRVRDELWARLSRNAFYDLVDLADSNASGCVVRSNGCQYTLG